MSQRRTLTEAYTTGSPDEPALKVDESAGVIFGVKVLGRFSRNSHGAAGATSGSEYALAAMKAALPLYEGIDVIVDHPKRGDADASRSSRDAFGKLRNVRMDGDDIRADLHYLRSDPMAPKVVEDVTRRLGIYGLSHNAASGRERLDRSTGRLVIESIELVRSVDLVRKPATNRNLWESTVADETKPTPKITFRALLESQGKRWSKGRKLWADRLLEMDELTGAVAAPVEVAPESTDPDDALWGGFQSAINAVLGKYEAGETDAAGALAKIKELLTTHEKLDAEDEPEAPDESAEDTGSDAAKTESVKPDADAAELAKLRREKVVRNLCESLEYTPTKPQFAALVALDAESDRKALIEELKATPAKPGVRAPRSGRTLTESEKGGKPAVPDAAATASLISGLSGY